LGVASILVLASTLVLEDSLTLLLLVDRVDCLVLATPAKALEDSLVLALVDNRLASTRGRLASDSVDRATLASASTMLDVLPATSISEASLGSMARTTIRILQEPLQPLAISSRMLDSTGDKGSRDSSVKLDSRTIK